MKKSIITSIFGGALCYIILSSNASGYRADATGASGAATGPNQGCSCHGAVNSAINVTIELDSAGSPVSHYTPGGSYTVKISGSNTGSATLTGFGFQLSSVLANQKDLSLKAGINSVQGGTWGSSLPTGTRALSLGSLTVISQSSTLPATSGSGGSGTTYSESIPWTAPSAGSGAVVFYGVINAVNGNGSDGGDQQNVARPLMIQPIGTNISCN